MSHARRAGSESARSCSWLALPSVAPRSRFGAALLLALILPALIALALSANAQGQVLREAKLLPLDDLRQLAPTMQRQGRPLLLFFTTPGCPYCREVRRNYLAPRAAQADGGGVLIREVDILSDRSFAGPDGRRLTERALAMRFEVVAVPVVLLVDAQLRPLAEPLLGLNPAFYESYLQARIDEATARTVQARQ
jgi:thioredoxin-related protein